MKPNIPDVKVVSFDIFDTLLYRITGEPESVFRLMKRKLIEDQNETLGSDFIDNFVETRKNAPILLRNTLKREADFGEIYEFIGTVWDLRNGDIEKLQLLEIETEKKVLRPLKKNIELLNDLLISSRKVIISSDMYHEEKVLRNFLKPFIYNQGEDVAFFVSSKYGKTKRSGELFRVILKELNITPKDLVHLGDDWEADVLSPQKLGILAMHFPRECRKSLCAHLMRSELPAIAAAASISASLKSEDSVFMAGSTIAGPLLTSFVIWTLRKARELRISKLFFLARDGYILKKIAEELDPKLTQSIKLSYLQLSRFSVVTACYHMEWSKEIWDFIFLDVPIVSFSEVSSRLLLEPRELYKLMKKHGYRNQQPTVVTETIAAFIKKVLDNDEETVRKIRERSEQKKRNLMSYLGTKDFDPKNSALVDVGWKGTIQDFLYNILLTKEKDTLITGLYFGLCAYTRFQTRANRKFAYGFYPFTPLKFSPNLLRFLEIFTHVNEPSTQSYNLLGEVILVQNFAELNKSYVDSLQKGILEFVGAARKECALDLIYEREHYYVYLREFEFPDKKLADAIGDYCYLLGTNDEIQVPIAPSESLFAALKRKFQKESPLWPQGYLVRQKTLTRTCLQLARKTRGLFLSFKNLIKSWIK